MNAPLPRVLDVLGTLVRLGLAAVWLISGGVKAADPQQTYVSVQAYEVIPVDLGWLVAGALPYFELALGILLLVGIGTRIVAWASAGLLLLFIAGIVQAWARGLTIDCGCFGGGGQVAEGQTQYPQEIARDTGFLALAVWLMIRPRSWASLDGLLLGNRSYEANEHVDSPDNNNPDTQRSTVSGAQNTQGSGEGQR